MSVSPELEIVEFASREDWRSWLEREHELAPCVWLKIAKKYTPIPTVSYPEAVEVALCYGWIDGQKGRFDDEYWLQRFTPRRARSRWSKVNTEKVQTLTASGEMHAAGLREVEAAKADGRWEAAYSGQREATVPADLQAALDADPRAKAFFDSLESANRYAILYRIAEAKRPETRARRIAKYVTMCRAGERVHLI